VVSVAVMSTVRGIEPPVNSHLAKSGSAFRGQRQLEPINQTSGFIESINGYTRFETMRTVVFLIAGLFTLPRSTSMPLTHPRSLNFCLRCTIVSAGAVFG
jgi:hypothetical protein